ncbi:MAG: hypothetical protein AAGD96_11325 [Chloroflexota bacterium]
METVKLKELMRHPAHDRSTLDQKMMASLAYSMYTQGFDADEAIEVTTREKGGYYIVSGHRRTIGRLLAAAVEAKMGTATGYPDLTLESFGQVFNEIVGEEDLFLLAEELKAEHGEIEIPGRLKDGSGVDLITRLMRANANREKTDLLGRARTWLAAMEEGMSEKQIAQINGVAVKEVKETLPLAQIDENIAFLILTGTFKLSVAAELMKLDDAKRNGVEQFILTNQDKLNTTQIIEVIRGVKNWKDFEIPLNPKHQAQYNIAMGIASYWSLLCENCPELIWGLAALLIHHGVDSKPWSDKDKTLSFFKFTGGDIYFDVAKNAVKWPAVLTLMKHVSCETCPVSKLPEQRLEDELKLPCRQKKSVQDRCMHGLTPNGTIKMRVPESWGGLEGVEGDKGNYFVTSKDALNAAWAAKRNAEQVEREAEAEQVEAEKKKKKKAEQSSKTEPAADGSGDSSKPKVEKVSHVKQKRMEIQFFMDNHTLTNPGHPWATPCSTCVHKLDKSPVKSDKNAPHCQWAKGGKPVRFEALVPHVPDGQEAPAAQTVWMCKQHKPEDDFVTLIPEATNKPKKLDRDMYKAWIRELWSKISSRYTDERLPLAQLVGRPITGEAYKDWLIELFEENIGQLTDGQIWTVHLWLNTLFLDRDNHQVRLPADDSAEVMQVYRQTSIDMQKPLVGAQAEATAEVQDE